MIIVMRNLILGSGNDGNKAAHKIGDVGSGQHQRIATRAHYFESSAISCHSVSSQLLCTTVAGLGAMVDMHTLARETVSSPEEAGDITPGSIMLLRASFSSKEEIRRCLLRRPARRLLSCLTLNFAIQICTCPNTLWSCTGSQTQLACLARL